MELIERIETILSDSLSHMGYDIVRIQINGNVRRHLQIMIERLDNTPITIDDCTNVSRHVSVLLDAEDPIKGNYVLEVSSPGLDRPLVKPEHFKRFVENKVEVQTILAVNNRRKFIGTLEIATDDAITLVLDHPMDDGQTKIMFNYSDIRSAHLHIKF